MCDLELEGYGRLLRDTQHRAKKQRDCDECRRKICPGQIYFKVAGIWEGDFFTVSHCSRCVKARNWLQRQGHGWTDGRILRDVRYCVSTDKERLLEAGRKKRA